MLKIERVVAAALAGVVVSGAAAQDAVQWRVEDGGNGHWYQPDLRNLGWYSARLASEYKGGHLVTITSIQENEWIVASLPARPCSTSGGHWHIGAYQEASDPEPAGFRWVTGEPFEFTNWSAGSPSNSTDYCKEGEDVLVLWGVSGACGSSAYSGRWNDLPACGDEWGPGFVVEWSADCNGDGVVDYGQVLDGTYADKDANGVPDCCEGACPGDLNGDDAVGPPDLGVLLALWGTDGGEIGGADLNSDGTVNAADLGLLIGAWGECGCN